MEKLLAGVLFVIVVILAARLWRYRRQVDHLLGQISLLEQEDTNYRLSSCCPVGRTEKLINELNRVWDQGRERMISLRRESRSYRESITGISHDIRTPLTSAKGYIQMLRSGSVTDGEKQRSYLEKVERRLDDVVELLEQLFEYARVEAGERSFDREKVNLSNLFMDTLSLFYEDFVQRGCEPAVNIGEEPVFIEADAGGIKRILENIVKNALVHGKGGYRLSLSRQDGSAVITASNFTDSIEKGDMEHIFDRFYTTDQSRTLRTTGLGLSIVKQFTEAMGGRVSASLADGVFAIQVVFPLA